MKDNKKTAISIIFVMFFLMSCTENARQRPFIEKARAISDRYGLDDAVITLDYLPENPLPAKMHNMKITTKKFSNLSDEQKLLYLSEVNRIDTNSNYVLRAEVISDQVYFIRSDDYFMANDLPLYPYGTPTKKPNDRIVFRPPVEVELILTENDPYVLAAATIDYLTAYEGYNVKDNNSPTLRRIYDDGYAFYIDEDTKVLLFLIDGDFASIQLISPHWDKKIGDFAWIRKKNLKSFPKP